MSNQEPETVTVPALLIAAYENLDSMIRLAMTTPDTGEMLVAAIHAIDTARSELGITVDHSNKKMSALMADLLGRLNSRVDS